MGCGDKVRTFRRRLLENLVAVPIQWPVTSGEDLNYLIFSGVIAPLPAMIF